VQARAARVWPARCGALAKLTAERWPDGPFPEGGYAPPDVVGEVLAALAGCEQPTARAEAKRLGALVVARWSTAGLEKSPRLHRLAAGLCAARPVDCPRALAATAGLKVDPEHPPALTELARLARR
jgi:hypothetical protein